MADLAQIGSQSLGQLPGLEYLTIRRTLNIADSWQMFVSVLDGRFTLRNDELRSIESDDDPGNKLMMAMVKRAMTIQQFVDYAAQAEIQSILNIFNVRVPIRITQQPFPYWDVTAGESLTFEIRASGNPQPIFQWFYNHQPLLNANSNVLHFPTTSVRHSGTYVCQVRGTGPEDDIIQSDEVLVSVTAQKPLTIKEHPRSCTLNAGGIAVFRCEVWGDLSVDYQWLRNGKEITDSGNIVGTDTNELKIYNLTKDWVGCYFCRISQGEEVLCTQDAVLQVDWRRKLSSNGMSYTATDKVALLIGAGDYRSEPRLSAPKYDVQAMAAIFRNLNFKVVSLLDLTKKEMIAAIYEFSHLIGEGVYCVFYFCGHGFETGGQCFLLPPDAPQGYDYTHCLSADAILFNVFLQKRPQLCCMILDICRLSHAGVPERLKPPLGEYVICYATSLGHYSYEQHNSGFLVSNLKNVLQSDISIDQVFIELKAVIKEDPILKGEHPDGEEKKQAPEIRGNLSDDRSFRDPINTTGYTEAFTKRQLAWENSHCQPASREIEVPVLPDFTVTIRLDFQAEFSNVLKIFTSVIDPGQARTCKAYVSEIPADVAVKAKVTMLQQETENSLCKNFVPLHDIQRLKTPLVVKVCICCTLHDNREIRHSVEQHLGWPLVSRLELWKEVPNPIRHHEAEEAMYV